MEVNNATAQDGTSATITSVNNSARITNLAYKVGVGSKYSLSSDFDLDFRYQYVDLGKFKTSQIKKGYLNGTYIGEMIAGSARGKLRAHEVLAGVSYKF